MIQLTSISGVVNQEISATIGSVAMPANTYAKAMLIQTRDGNPFRVYPGSAAGGAYFSVGSGTALSAEISGTPGKRILWIRTESGTDTLEILLFNA